MVQTPINCAGHLKAVLPHNKVRKALNRVFLVNTSYTTCVESSEVGGLPVVLDQSRNPIWIRFSSRVKYSDYWGTSCATVPGLPHISLLRDAVCCVYFFQQPNKEFLCTETTCLYAIVVTEQNFIMFGAIIMMERYFTMFGIRYRQLLYDFKQLHNECRKIHGRIACDSECFFLHVTML